MQKKSTAPVKLLKAAIMAAEMLMNRDKYCLNVNKAFRAGKIGPKPE